MDFEHVFRKAYAVKHKHNSRALPVSRIVVKETDEPYTDRPNVKASISLQIVKKEDVLIVHYLPN